MKNKTRVVNVNKEPYDVFIGRPSKFGNPFSIGIDGNRSEVIKKYKMWLMGEIDAPKHHWWYKPPTLDMIYELKGKTLGCFCRPKMCHGDVLVSLIEAKEIENFMKGGK